MKSIHSGLVPKLLNSISFPNLFLSLFLITFASSIKSQEIKSWTIMYYAAGCNSSEVDLLNDIEEMKRGKQDDSYELICLIDRIEGHSEDNEALGENFTDTRMYRLGNNKYESLEGGNHFPDINNKNKVDLNLGDANTLKKFIQYCKQIYPAKNYMLILRSHGNGMAMCPDNEEDPADRLYSAELTDVLGKEESVDILGLDVCSMAGLENAYQYRPNSDNFSCDYLIASAPLSAAWAYDQILGRLSKTNDGIAVLDDNYFSEGKEFFINPETMTAFEFSRLIMEEIYDSQRWASWALFDNQYISEVKENIDVLAQHLSKEKNDKIYKIIENTLNYYENSNQNIEIAQLTSPHIDAYDFYRKISNLDDISPKSKEAAIKVMEAIDNLTIDSYYGTGYLPPTDSFENGINGIYQIIPLGKNIFSESNGTFWSHTTWFHPADRSHESHSYGKYAWCIDGATPNNNKIENFFEYLDFLFENNSFQHGDCNNYKY